MIKPKALQAGDHVAVISPASGFEAKVLERGLRVLETLELVPEVFQKEPSTHPYLAAPDDDRLAELHWAFSEKSIKGIFCARGGYGCMRLLDRLKPEIIRQNPKVFVGYSDITVLLNLFTTHYSTVSFHGPMVAADLAENVQPIVIESLKRAIMTAKPLDEISSQEVTGREPITINPGVGRGLLVGGNLTLLCATLGTDYEIQTDGKILFLEDRGERPYRIDRLMQHLKLAKKLSRVTGIVLGDFCECHDPQAAGSQSPPDEEAVVEVLRDVLAGLQVPILYGFPAGHGGKQVTLPLGVGVSLDANRGVLQFLEAGVV